MRSLLVILLVTISVALATSAKIHPSLQTSLKTKASVNIFVGVKNGDTDAVLAHVDSTLTTKSTHTERATSVYNALNEHARITQKSVLEFIKVNLPQVKPKSFWINNQIYLPGVDSNAVNILASFADVAEIQEEAATHIENVYAGPDGPSVDGRGEILAEWGLENMRVPEVWAQYGNTGEGLIIGNIDTGVRGSHELLRDKWVGLAGNGWFDPEKMTTFPFDIYNHGTHTMGGIVGDNGIGIAPGGRWLACKGYRDNGSSTSGEFLACLQYMLCPHDTNGANADCSKTPHVVSNSWGWNGNTNWFNSAIYAWNTAGIVSSFSAGNTGSSCVSIYSPADQPNVLAVGATDSNNARASFSSLGPSPGGQLKPEISAPGVSIRSASAASDTAYMVASGTSMSCPSATGVMALLKNADRSLTQARAVDILQRTARRNNAAGQTCGGVADSIFPNNHVGHGVVDALAAYQLLLSTK